MADGKAERSVGLKVATLVAERAAQMGMNLAASLVGRLVELMVEQ